MTPDIQNILDHWYERNLIGIKCGAWRDPSPVDSPFYVRVYHDGVSLPLAQVVLDPCGSPIEWTADPGGAAYALTQPPQVFASPVIETMLIYEGGETHTYHGSELVRVEIRK